MEAWLLSLDGVYIYIGLFFLLLGGAVGFPIPEDLPLVLAGVMVHRGVARLDYAFFVCYVAVIMGDMILYVAGRRLGPALFRKRWFRSRIAPGKLQKIRVRLEQRSLAMIFVARHLFYFRSITFLLCGAVRMRISTFLIADAIAALVSVPIMIGLGYATAEHYDVLVGWLGKAKIYVFIGVTVVLVGYVIYVQRRRRLQSSP